jgi:hypothetical protein
MMKQLWHQIYNHPHLFPNALMVILMAFAMPLIFQLMAIAIKPLGITWGCILLAAWAVKRIYR